MNSYLHALLMGIGMGVSVLGRQYWGKKEISPIRRVSSVGLKFSLAMGLLFLVLTSVAPEFCLRLFTNESEVISEGMLYLDIMRWTYLIFAISNVLMYSLQSVETAFIGTIMSVSTIIINMCLNYCFIFGNFGAPEMGIRGAAIATLTSRCVELVIILIYIFFIDKKLKFRPRHLINLDFAYLKDFAKAALPVMVSGALWGVAQGAQTAVLGHMSATVIAANSIASVI